METPFANRRIVLIHKNTPLAQSTHINDHLNMHDGPFPNYPHAICGHTPYSGTYQLVEASGLQDALDRYPAICKNCVTEFAIYGHPKYHGEIISTLYYPPEGRKYD